MEFADRRADLIVRVAGDILHQEIDQAAFLLKHREKIDDLGIRLIRRWRCRGGADCFGGRPAGFGLWTGEDGSQEKNGRHKNGKCYES